MGNNPAKCEEIRKNNLSNVIQIMRHDGLINEKEGEFQGLASSSDFSKYTLFQMRPSGGSSPSKTYSVAIPNSAALRNRILPIAAEIFAIT